MVKAALTKLSRRLPYAGPMPSLTLPDRLIWFAHCPKAGGTSVERAMIERWGAAVGHLHWGWDLWWKRGGWRVADPPNSPQHLVWTDARAALPRAPDAVFALVREPVARMVSEHAFQRRHRRGTRAGRALAHLPFPLWLRLMLAVARLNPHAFDNHLRPQADFIPDGAAVFRLEDGLGPALSWLSAATGAGMPAAPPHELRGGGAAPVGATERARIGAAHAEDFARFGYPAPGPLPGRDGFDHLAAALAPLAAFLERRGLL